MNFYPHHISDFNNATRHLTRVERSVYRDAIERYYDTESPLCTDLVSLSKRLLCFSDEEKEALKSILAEFFDLTDSGYVNDRCELEIGKYRANTSAKAKAGKASAQSRMNKSRERKQNSSHVEQISTRVNNQEPLTINHKPITSNQLDYSCWPQQPAQQTMDDWMAMRKRLKANVSQTVINRFASELKKAVQFGYSVDFCLQECVTRNWRGFEVQWLLNSGVSHAQSKRFTQPSDNRDKAARAADEAFGISERGVFEGDFTRADPYGFIEQPQRGPVQDLD
jgi:uncharacterized protein YdaU (DUF1376 family)